MLYSVIFMAKKRGKSGKVKRGSKIINKALDGGNTAGQLSTKKKGIKQTISNVMIKIGLKRSGIKEETIKEAKKRISKEEVEEERARLIRLSPLERRARRDQLEVLLMTLKKNGLIHEGTKEEIYSLSEYDVFMVPKGERGFRPANSQNILEAEQIQLRPKVRNREQGDTTLAPDFFKGARFKDKTLIATVYHEYINRADFENLTQKEKDAIKIANIEIRA